MSWPIPILSKKELPFPPNLWFWTIFFVSLQIIAVIIGIFILNYDNPKVIVGLCLIPATLGWIILYIFCALKYIISLLLIKSWNKQIEKTDLLWKDWGKKKIVVLGNAILSSEEDGINKILEGKPPVFPLKGKPLYLRDVDFEELLQNQHQQLEIHYPNYHTQVKEFILLLPNNLSSKEQMYQDTIIKLWGQKPINIFHDINELQSFLNDGITHNKLILFISLQLWSNTPEEYSEFITSQLLSSTSFIKENNIDQIYGYIGRPISLPLYNIENDFKQFITYGCEDTNKIKSAWTNNINEDTNTNIILALGKNNISASTHNINYSFGPSGPLSLIFTIASGLEAAQKQKAEQFVFNKKDTNITLYKIS